MLLQAEADRLARMAKRMVGVRHLALPAPGHRHEWQAQSADGREDFLLDCNRGTIRLTKVTYQERHQIATILLRLDLDRPPHTNPDGDVIETPHLHIYREGYNDKWAVAVPSEIDLSSGDPAHIVVEFLRYCGFDPIPPLQGGALP